MNLAVNEAKNLTRIARMGRGFTRKYWKAKKINDLLPLQSKDP